MMASTVKEDELSKRKAEDSLGGMKEDKDYLNNFKTFLPSSSISLLPALNADTLVNLNVG